MWEEQSRNSMKMKTRARMKSKRKKRWQVACLWEDSPKLMNCQSWISWNCISRDAK
jgi:hypothetical protein